MGQKNQKKASNPINEKTFLDKFLVNTIVIGFPVAAMGLFSLGVYAALEDKKLYEKNQKQMTTEYQNSQQCICDSTTIHLEDTATPECDIEEMSKPTVNAVSPL